MAPLTINDNTVDTNRVEPGHIQPDASNTNFILLSTEHYLQPNEYRELGAHGVVIQRLEAMSDDLPTYLCRYEPSDLSALEALPFVRSALVYHEDFVLHPELKVEDLTHPDCSVPTKESISSEDGPLCRVQIQLHADTHQNGDDLFDELQSLLPETTGLAKVNSTSTLLQAWVPAKSLPTIASIDHVRSVYSAPDVRLYSIHASEIVAMPHSAWLNYPFQVKDGPGNGAGQVVAVVDSGLDTAHWDQGANGDIHPGFVTIKSPILKESRIANREVTYTGSNGELGLYDHDGHGTHVAGIVMGAYRDNTIGPISKQSVAVGAAPAAKVFVQKNEEWGPLESTYRSYEELFDEASQASGKIGTQIRIQNYSWGRGGQPWVRGYSPDGEAIDMLTDPNGARPRPLLVVQAAGNDGNNLLQPNSSTADQRLNTQIQTSATAKNALVVGSSWSKRRMEVSGDPDPQYKDTNCVEALGTKGLGAGGGIETDICISSSSSKGPTPGGLLKPDVVAPGVGILSTFSRGDWAQWRKKPKLGSPNYSPYANLSYMTGTSMAAPLVSGVAACIRETALARAPNATDIKAETMKAIIINGATSCQGGFFWYKVYQGRGTPITWARGTLGAPPDCIQGHGRVNCARSLRHITEMELPRPLVPLILPVPPVLPAPLIYMYSASGFFESINPISQGVTQDIDVILDKANRRFFATLVYHDKEGSLPQHSLVLSARLYRFNPLTRARTQIGAAKAPDAPHIYTEYPLAIDTTVKLGNVQKITLAVPDVPGLVGDDVRAVKLLVWCERITAARSVNYSLAWLSDNQ